MLWLACRQLLKVTTGDYSSTVDYSSAAQYIYLLYRHYRHYSSLLQSAAVCGRRPKIYWCGVPAWRQSLLYLDASDVSTTHPSKKLSHWWLGPFPVEWKVGNRAYRLHLPAAMKRVHPVFNIVKLTPASEDPIVRRHAPPPPLLEIVDEEEECYDLKRLRQSSTVVDSKVQGQMSLEECKS